MSIKSWFDRSRQPRQSNGEELSIDDLIVLERYAEAEDRLKRRVKLRPSDLHAHIKLAEVYVGVQEYDKAVGEYAYVADEYASDGFYEKARALLAKAIRLRPLDDSLQRKAAAYEQVKKFEQSRVVAVEGILSGGGSDSRKSTSALVVQQLWHNLTGSPLVSRLPPDQLKRLFAVMELKELQQGAVLARKGSHQEEIYLIVRGVIEAVAGRPGADVSVVRSFSSGDLIGERALMEHKPWPATYRVGEAASVLGLNREGLEQALLGNSDPRRFLDALREQHHDRDVAVIVERLEGGSG